MEEPASRSYESILRWSAHGKRLIAGVLMVMTFVLVGVMTIEILYGFLAFILPEGALSAPEVLLSEADLLRVLGLFLSVLIALELIETVEVYFHEHAIHVEIVVLVAVIALARKVIILDLKAYEPPVLIALGFLILVLGATYYLVRRAAPTE